ncbi:MAG: hypothetical protein IIA87_04465 [Nanoarchaeota archaeon]|nr:hypothetical protein [Nanoarchaeota archaeon]
MQKKSETHLLEEISLKLDILILINSISGKEGKEAKKILNNFAKTSKLSKREIERITGIDRHNF